MQMAIDIVFKGEEGLAKYRTEKGVCSRECYRDIKHEDECRKLQSLNLIMA